MSNLFLDNKVIPILTMPIENKDDKQTADEYHRQKLESMGLLASSIAHDFNNLLTGVIAHLSLATKNLQEEDEAQIFVAKALNSAQKAVNLAQHLLEFATTGSTAAELVDINELIHNSLPLFRLATNKIALQINLSPQLPTVYLVKAQLQQLLFNLIQNAVEAITPNNGLIEITTTLVSELPANPQAVTIGYHQFDCHHLLIQVKDNGLGMSYNTMQQITKPFFTTKESGHGLGLTTIAEMVKDQRAVFRIESVLGQGSTFSLYMPVIQTP